MELSDDADRVERVIRLDGDWSFATELREDGEWAVFAIPVNPDHPGGDVFHALAMMAVTIDQHGLINEDSNEKWDWLLEGGGA